ncbi:glycogen [Aspergillus niger]|nr:glycogen [Aspergillus niger]
MFSASPARRSTKVPSMAAAYHVRSGYIRLELTGVNLWLNYDIASVPMSHHLDDHGNTDIVLRDIPLSRHAVESIAGCIGMKSLRKPLQRIRSQYEVVSRGEPCHQHHYDNLAIFPPMIVVAVQLVAAGKRSDTLRRPGSLSAAPGSQAGRHMRLVTSRDGSFPQICPELVQAETKSVPLSALKASMASEDNGQEPIKRDVRNHILFEVATEVANRVGGIYSVLKSKAPVTTAEYGDRYTLIGPLNRASAAVEVEELTPSNPRMIETIQSMKERGIEIVYGRWLIEGAPRVLLIDTGTGYKYLDEWKGDLWNAAGIPSPSADTETNEAIVFGYLVAWFLGEFIAHERRRAVVAHFHEWLAGVALPLTKKRHMDLTTIFTTHATLLGRYLCAGSVDFYNNLQYFDVDAEAGKRGIYHRYCIERAAAHTADVFTTVSHITAFESEHLLKRKPDGVLPNGLNVKKFSAVHEFQNLHSQSKEKINDFVRGHFYGHNNFDLDNTLYVFTAGRYEFRNKGVDMFIEGLARLNHRLKEAGSKMTVVAFIIMPAQTSSLTVEALKGQAVVKSLKDTIEMIEKGIGRRMYERCLAWKEGDNMPDEKDLMASQDRVLLRRRLFAMKRHSLPPIVTHNMYNDHEDPILNQIRRVQLFNHESDRVKVVFHPEFLNSSNPVLPLDYDDFVRGTHLGVFPSYYEPWGYTPAECTVMGVPSITTNLSGFGCYMEELIENSSDYGIYIVDRRMKGVDDSVNQLTEFMFNFTQKSRRQRINQRNRTERLSDLLDWKRMGLEYVKARQLALRRAYPSSFGTPDDVYDVIGGTEQKISRPLSVPGSPRDRSGMMTPGDFASLQEVKEGLSTEDYVAWRLPTSEEEEPDDHYFPLTLRTKKNADRPASPLDQLSVNGDS